MNKLIYTIVVTLLLAFSLFSCKDLIEVEPDNVLEPDQYYRDKFDADAAVYGIYGQLYDIASQYVILNELRADLADVTGNSDKFMHELNNHDVSQGNPYTSTKTFYKIILNCNDVLKNFDIMLRDNKLEEQEYAQRYSDIVTVRSWLYHQLSIHYDRVPYITEAFLEPEELNDLSRFPMLSLEEMTPTLIAAMEALPFKDQYPASSSLFTSFDTYSTFNTFINKKFFLGDLYLWHGDYQLAATNYKAVMITPVPGVDFFDSYRVKYAEVASNEDIAVGYIRNREQDVNALINSFTQGWKSIFARPQDRLFLSEWIWVLPYKSNYKPQNPFFDLFAITGGKYQIKPSQIAINLWDAQTQRNGFGFDQRGPFTYSMQNGQPVIMKYIYNYTPPLEKNGKWFLNRAALLHLRFAEAANRDNKIKLALALLNNGIGNAFDPDPLSTASRDVTNIQKTSYLAPYDFNARNGQIPNYRDVWHRNAGIRGRAYVTPVLIPAGSSADSVRNVENALIDEAALELAYEGNRWPDLLRIAIRRKGEDLNFLANKIGDKLQKAGNPQSEITRQRLKDVNSWFIPFKME